MDFRNEDNKYKHRRLDVPNAKDYNQGSSTSVPSETESNTSLIQYISVNSSETFDRKSIDQRGVKNVCYNHIENG